MPQLLIEEPAQPVGQPNATPGMFGALQGDALQRMGRVSQALGEVILTNAETQAKTRAMQFDADLKAERDMISTEPDIEKRAGLFDEAEKRLMDKYRPGGLSGGAGVFDQYAGMSASEHRSALEYRTAVDGINQTREGKGQIVGHLANKAAYAESYEEADAYFKEGELELSDDAAQRVFSQDELLEVRQKSVGDAINLMAEKNPSMASQFHERFKEMLPADVNAALEKKLKTEGDIEDAQIVADSIVDDLGWDAPLDEMLKAARGRSSGAVRERAETQLKESWSAYQQSKNQRQTDALDAYAQEIGAVFDGEEPPDPANLTATWHTIRRKAEASGLGHSEVSQLKSLWDNYSSSGGKPKVETDWNFYEDVFSNPEKLGTRGYTTADLELRLGPTELKQAIQLRNDMRAGVLPNQAVITREINAEFDRQGIKDAKEKGFYRSMIQTRLEANEKVPTPAEIRAEAQSAIATKVDAGIAFFDNPQKGLEQHIASMRDGDPSLYRLAYWYASEGGNLTPTDLQIDAQVTKIERRLAKDQGTKPRHDAMLRRYRAEGDRAAQELLGRGYSLEDVNATEADVAEWGVKPEGSW